MRFSCRMMHFGIETVACQSVGSVVGLDRRGQRCGNIEIIGEAAKSLSDLLRDESSYIPWRNLAGMRDKLTHHYVGSYLSSVL